MKTCKACGTEKTINEFRQGANICKLCTTAQTKAYAVAHKEKLAKWARAYRAKNKERINAKKRALYPKTKEANRSRDKVRRALKRGDIASRPCQMCGDSKSQAHHPDYQKPLEVIWLCVSCHKLVHAQLKRWAGGGQQR